MNKFLRIFILSVFCLSCSSDLDFDQVNGLKLKPVVVANLVTFDIQANQFVVGGVEQPFSGDLMDFDVFKQTFLDQNLNRADFFFEINNTINRGFRINLTLLDANNTPLYSIPFDVPAYTVGQTPVTKTEIFQNAKLDLLKNTSKIAFVINLLPGPALSESSLGSLKLRSSATLYFVVE
ncbi:hypothetical protein [Flavobacterium limnophilum]|uniref:hypothetical protein n=1 Tax=Flavobacterium limnophilum TaxID=3003262 RepID=UPI002482FC5A|nr:hypothetical protein [Flavobacterium limnophilum]